MKNIKNKQQAAMHTFAWKRKRQMDIAGHLVDIGMDWSTATIAASDMQTAEDATELVTQGGDPKQLIYRVGSYARFEWARQHLAHAQLISILPEQWAGSDPAYDRCRYLKLWQEAHAKNNYLPIIDYARDCLPASWRT